MVSASDDNPVLPGRREWLTLVLPLSAAALVLKALFLFAVSDNIFVTTLINDEVHHFNSAKQIMTEGLVRDEAFYFAPLYNYILALFFTLFGEDHFAFKGVQVVAGAINVGAVYVLARVIFGHRLVAVIAAVLTLLYGMFYFYEVLLLKTTFAILLTNVGLLLLFLASRDNARRWNWLWFASGVVFGLTSLLRGNTLVVMLFVLSGVLVLWRLKQAKLLDGSLLAAGLLLAISPATVHNAVVSHDFVLTTWQGGTNLYIGNHPGASGIYESLNPDRQVPDWEREDARSIAEEAVGRSLKPSEVQAYWVVKSVKFAFSSPVRFIRLTWKKFRLFHGNPENEDTIDYGVFRELSPGLHAAFLPFGLVSSLSAVGLVLTLPDWRRYLLVYFTLVGLVFSVILFFIFSRYRIPAVSLHFVLAAYALYRMWYWLAPRHIGRAAVVLCAVGLLMYASMQELVEVHPAATYNNLALKYMANRRFEEAKVYFQLAIESAPPTFGMHNNLALALEQLGDFEGSLKEAKTALGILRNQENPPFSRAAQAQFADIYKLINRLLVKAGRPEEADQFNASSRQWQLDRLLDQPRDAERDFNIGMIHMQEKEYDQAVVYFESACDQQPDNLAILMQAGYAYVKLDQYEKALAYYRRATELSPEDPSPMHMTGNCYYQLGQVGQAMAFWKRAIDSGSADPALKQNYELLRRQMEGD